MSEQRFEYEVTRQRYEEEFNDWVNAVDKDARYIAEQEAKTLGVNKDYINHLESAFVLRL